MLSLSVDVCGRCCSLVVAHRNFLLMVIVVCYCLLFVVGRRRWCRLVCVLFYGCRCCYVLSFLKRCVVARCCCALCVVCCVLVSVFVRNRRCWVFPCWLRFVVACVCWCALLLLFVGCVCAVCLLVCVVLCCVVFGVAVVGRGVLLVDGCCCVLLFVACQALLML